MHNIKIDLPEDGGKVLTGCYWLLVGFGVEVC
jgi:hypothetical protein